MILELCNFLTYSTWGLSLDEFFKKAKGKNTEKSHHRSRHKDSGKSDTENKSDKENQQKPLEKKLKLSARENVPKLRVQSVSKPALLPNEKKTTLNRKIPGSPQRSAPKVKLGEIVLTAASRSDSSDLDSEEDGGPAPRNKGARATDSTAAVDSRGETINDSRGETIEAQDESSDSGMYSAYVNTISNFTTFKCIYLFIFLVEAQEDIICNYSDNFSVLWILFIWFRSANPDPKNFFPWKKYNNQKWFFCNLWFYVFKKKKWFLKIF